MQFPTGIADRITPVRAAFFGSLLLSSIAIGTSPAINRDGMLYVDSARAFLENGFGAASAVFNWPYLSILIAIVSRITGLGLDSSAYLLNSLFLAGTCGLLVSCAARKFPEAVWPTCLVLLALPGLNHYREEVIREYGCWFFLITSIWIALRWTEAPQWRTAFALQTALVCAALFRPEALAYFIALSGWQFVAGREDQRWRRTLMISGLPLAGFFILLALYLFGYLGSVGRLSGEFRRFSLAGFDEKAAALAAALIPYARDQARTILFFGSVFIIPLKFFKQLGLFVVPLLFLFSTTSWRAAFVRWQPFSWFFLVHLLVLGVFALDLQFLAGRYVAVLSLLATPVIGYGLWLLMQRYPRWKLALVAIACVVMVSNVLSLAPRKTYLVEAGSWLADNAKESSRVYVENSAVAHYAGWRLPRNEPPEDRTWLIDAVMLKKYDLLVLESGPGDPDIKLWLAGAGLEEIQRFGRSGGVEIIVAAPTLLPSDSK